MKFRVTMKDPDTLHDAIRDAIERQLTAEGLTDPEERELVMEKRQARIRKQCAKWFDYGEYLTVEIDTDASTCEVVLKHE